MTKLQSRLAGIKERNEQMRKNFSPANRLPLMSVEKEPYVKVVVAGIVHDHESIKFLLALVEKYEQALESIAAIGVHELEKKIALAGRAALVSLIDTDTVIAREALAEAERLAGEEA